VQTWLAAQPGAWRAGIEVVALDRPRRRTPAVAAKSGVTAIC
jgi:hypothetical protein